jgi:phage terminase large subunit
MINGHEIYFWGLDDIEKLKSLEIGWFWFDDIYLPVISEQS